MGREIFVQRAVGSSAVYAVCTECAWTFSVGLATGQDTDKGIGIAFDAHYCEFYPECHVMGCTEPAAYGFREMIDGNTMTTSGLRMGDRPNWCLKHDAKMRKGYEHVNGKYVSFLT